VGKERGRVEQSESNIVERKEIERGSISSMFYIQLLRS